MTIDTVILDIEGTVCPITFVKDTLFPYFLTKLPSILSSIEFPLSTSSSTNDDPIIQILKQLPESITISNESVFSYLKNLVDQDIKDPILKSLQGYIWEKGYEIGDLKAPIYKDSIKFIENFNKKIYIYSSGSIKAQILLFGHAEKDQESINLNPFLKGYFDITTAGFKNKSESYIKILNEINKSNDPSSVLFLSDNVNEVKSAIESGMNSYIVIRPGNAPLSDDDKSTYKTIHSLDELTL
ncbi:hypothetical protein CTRG_01277 [Candida tropicalis MYA-3404]|uniref:Enolase-phosphatase E1 n=1 Tax=Candida tropicalis (strain ATCC MYA-3404 / T1) TaxID=294747 RepID=ENOPH_CANTT|nr:hypothetical protein CTRG_01277 [Candida tropicalis MYA-3404]C5M5Z6.1 RecName: Full=Enolase-phosphatase E1; AltName: Full=2,3-diketo-5-methylthio-1-phosphopentane phosphatase [Candida tropicalis MYA-3404]EER34416.1 hypothetical protein CTRG_01277 [Candida tropicalis MYA-3404]KAG4408287.1 hypothetical protein JTP64_001593 [Candida tropicalis]